MDLLKQKLITLEINSMIFYFFSTLCSREPVPVDIKLGATAETNSISAINQRVDMGTPPKKSWQTIENAKTIARDATTKAVGFYHDTSEVVTDLQKRVAGTIRSEVSYANKKIVPTVLGVPFYYYEHVLLVGCLSQCTLSFTIKNILGTIFAVAATVHFVQWILSIQQKKAIEDASKKEIEIP